MELTRAAISDLPALIQLLILPFSQEAEFSPSHDAQRRGLELILGSPKTGHILVARDDDKVLATVSLPYTASTALEAKGGVA